MKSVVILCFLPFCLLGQAVKSPRFSVSVGGGLPLAYVTLNKYVERSGANNVSNIKDAGFPLSYTLKAEYSVLRNLSVGFAVNRFKYLREFDADIFNWDADSTFTHHFVNGNGRTNVTLRANVLLIRETFAVYAGLGAGWMLADYYVDYTIPNMSSWGRDSDTIPFNIEWTVGYRMFPFKQSRSIGFFAEAGLAQSWLQLGLTWRR